MSSRKLIQEDLEVSCWYYIALHNHTPLHIAPLYTFVFTLLFSLTFTNSSCAPYKY